MKLSEAMKLSEIARRASNLMKNFGHCKGSFQDYEGKVCYRGAIHLAMGMRADDHSSGVRTVEDQISKVSADLLRGKDTRFYSSLLGDSQTNSMAMWNNRESVKAEEVIDILARTAARLEAIGQ